jgi:hypothetical protein
MRILLTLRAAPLVVFWGWFGLSYYDVNFGYVMLTRKVHELIFELYGHMLGVDPATIPWLIAKACVFDTMLILAIYGFRRRRQIRAWWAARRERYLGAESTPSA